MLMFVVWMDLLLAILKKSAVHSCKLIFFLVACQSVCFDDVCFWCQWYLEYLLFTAYTWCSSFLACSCQTLAQKKPSPTRRRTFASRTATKMLFNTSCPQVLHVFFSKVLSCNLSTCFVDFVKTSNRTESWSKPSNWGSETTGECTDGNRSSAQSSGGYEGWASAKVDTLLQKCDQMSIRHYKHTLKSYCRLFFGAFDLNSEHPLAACFE